MERIKVQMGNSKTNTTAFQVWDVGGQEKLRPLWKSYTRRTDGTGVCGGRGRDGAHGGGQSGAPPDHTIGGEPGGARAGSGKQTGPGWSHVSFRGGEGADTPRAELVYTAPHAGLLSAGRSGPAARPGETLLR
ncbi:ADP-ribosylation factor-like protein 4A [Larimichthys crocea]|uniref:Uncharacterized protein n=1 Tax=Larimichthys crocea TaxID=215358 RepID=A0ACD3R751_LARCR|nr:ADP-ribosylation factor-like protein 4A [Larimichthys crocea]